MESTSPTSPGSTITAQRWLLARLWCSREPKRALTKRNRTVDCQPTSAQVAKYAHIQIGESSSHFTSHFVSFQDSHLEATFTIPKSEVAKYLSLVAYPGVKLDQPSAQIHDPKTGEYRQLDLTTKGKTVEVRLIVFSA